MSSQVTPETLDPAETFEGRLGWLLNDVYWILSKEFGRRGAELGLTSSQWRVLAHLQRADGLTQTELSGLIGMEKAPLGRLIDRLEDSGLIMRRPDPSDRRVKRVYANDTALERLAPMRAVAEEVFAQALNGLSPSQVDQFVAALQQIKSNLTVD